MRGGVTLFHDCNITIIAALFVTIFGRAFGPRRGAIFAALAIGLYTLLVGGDAAVVRAAIMGWIGLLGRQVGRHQTGVLSLVFTAAVMSVFNPQVLWDVGFQLSFTATLGLVLYAAPLSSWFVDLASQRLPEKTVDRLVGPVGDYFLFTLAAQITTLPLLIYYFQRLSISSLPANIAILPAQPPIMIVGGLAVLLGLLIAPLGQVVAYFALPFAAYTIRVVEWFAKIPGGVIVLGEISLLVVVLIYFILFALTAWWGWFKDNLPAPRQGLVFAALTLTTVFAWQAYSFSPDGLLHITLLDVGTGDALLIQTPTGRYVLVNGGPSATKLSDGIGRRLPIFHRQLDFLVVAASREQQVAALPRTIQRFAPDQVLWAGPVNASRSSSFLTKTLTAAHISTTAAQPGHVLDLGDGAQLGVLTASARGAVLLLSWDNFRLLLPLGLSFEDIEALDNGRPLGGVTALLLGDNGYAPLNPPEWLANLHPQVVLLSVAAGDFDGLPSPDTLAALEDYTVLRTDHYGWIEITTDGQKMWLEVERK